MARKLKVRKLANMKVFGTAVHVKVKEDTYAGPPWRYLILRHGVGVMIGRRTTLSSLSKAKVNVNI